MVCCIFQEHVNAEIECIYAKETDCRTASFGNVLNMVAKRWYLIEVIAYFQIQTTRSKNVSKYIAAGVMDLQS